MVNVFLDQIASCAHLPKDGSTHSESWRKALVHTVSLPDIDHINVSVRVMATVSKSSSLMEGATTTTLTTTSSEATEQNDCSKDDDFIATSSLWYPDGSVALELREQISRQVQHNVNDVNVDYSDVRVRDLIRKRNTKKKMKQYPNPNKVNLY